MKVVTDLVGQFIIAILAKAGIKDNYRNDKKQEYNQAPFHVFKKRGKLQKLPLFERGAHHATFDQSNWFIS